MKSEIIFYFSWLLTPLTIIGTYFNSQQKKIGFLIWGICNICWLTIDLYYGIYAQAFLYSIFIGFNIYGWNKWG